MSASTLIMSKPATKIDPRLRKETMAFLEKLTTDDSTLGLHIEPIKDARDSRVRTGRVNQQFRAVLFRLEGTGDPVYVFTGVWNHDEAIAYAQRAELTVNPINGIPEIRDTPTISAAPQPPASASQRAMSMRTVLGYSAKELHEELGLDPDVAEQAATATSEDELLELADGLPEWQGMALIELAGATPLDEVKSKLGIKPQEPSVERRLTDADILRSFEHPAAKMTYAYIEDNEELRRVIEEGDYGAWRIFLHPEQRLYAERDWNGAYRLTGGAGTGKTVVLLHRARRLARANPEARVLLTTFTTNLAGDLGSSLTRLDPDLKRATELGQPGVWVSGIDALASAVLRTAKDEIDGVRERLLGSSHAGISRRTDAQAIWREVIDSSGGELPEHLRTVAFFESEYSMVILPNDITEQDQYLRIRRPGRGTRLNRAQRVAVWKVVESYRLSSRAQGTIDFGEAAVLAARYLDRVADAEGRRIFDHVLVDEAQDLSPAQLQLVRSLVAEGPNDVFIAEDSHQRIYGRRLTLGQFGLKITGRSRRLTLNYRTTEQNLRFAVSILENAEYEDLEDNPEGSVGYRSARTGPKPMFLHARSLAEELDQAANQVRNWLSDAEESGSAPQTIAILVRDRFQRDRVVAGLAERGVTVRAVDREAVPSGQPVVMTMHRAKGMEFFKILLFGLSSKSIPKTLSDYDYSEEEKADAMLRERSLLYVAATRARDELAVSWSDTPSELLPSAIA